MAAEALNRIPLSGGVATFILSADDDFGTVDNVDVLVKLDDGSRWSGTLLTLGAIGRILQRWKKTGECRNGSYFYCPDLLIMNEPGVPAMVDVLEELLRVGDIPDALQRVEDDDETED